MLGDLDLCEKSFFIILIIFINSYNMSFVYLPGHSGFMGYGDLWGFISHNLFITNPFLDLWGFMESPRVI